MDFLFSKDLISKQHVYESFVNNRVGVDPFKESLVYY